MPVFDPFAQTKSSAGVFDPFAQKETGPTEQQEEPKAKPKTQDEDYGAGTFSLDALKKVAGSLIGGTGATPEGIEQSVRGGVRAGLAGEQPTPGLKMFDTARIVLADTLGIRSIKDSMEDKNKANILADRAINAVPKIPGLRGLSDYMYSVQDDIEGSISDIGKERIEGSTPQGNIFKGEFSFGDDPTVSGYALQAAGVLGSMAPIIATSILTKDPSKAISRGTALGGGMAAGEGAKNARDKLGELSPEQLYEVSPYYKNLVDRGIKPAQAKEMTVSKASETGALLQGMVGALGSNVTSRILSGAFDKIIAKAGSSALGRGVATGAATGVEEGLGELGEGVAANIGVQKVLPSQELGEDSAANLTLGALGGAGPGAVKGVLTRPEEKQKLRTGSVLDKLGQEEEDAQRLITEPSGDRVGVAGKPSAGVPAGGPAEVDGAGVVPSGPDAESLDAGKEQRPSALSVDDFRSSYQELRQEALDLISLQRPTTEDGNRLKLIQRDLNEVVDDNAGLIKDPALLKQLKNPMFDGTSVIDALANQQGGEARAMQGDLFKGADRRTDSARALEGGSPEALLKGLNDDRARIQRSYDSGKYDSTWAMRVADQFGFTKAQALQNPEAVAQAYMKKAFGQIDQAVANLQRQPRAMQGDMFTTEPTKLVDIYTTRADALSKQLETANSELQQMQNLAARPVEETVSRPTPEAFSEKRKTITDLERELKGVQNEIATAQKAVAAGVTSIKAVPQKQAPTSLFEDQEAELAAASKQQTPLRYRRAGDSETQGDEDAARMDSLLQARELRKRLRESGIEGEFGAPEAAVEEAPVEEAAPAMPKAAPIEAPAVTTEHIPQTREGAQLVEFFNVIQPAAGAPAEQERHSNSKNTAASTMLEYDVAEPGQETSEGARKMLSYLANRVGGMDNLRTLVDALRNADASQQAGLFKRAGLPDLTSRRGMDAFSAEVQSYADQVGGTKGGVNVGSASIYSGRPYTENIPSSEVVTQEFGPTAEGKPRRPSQGQRDTSHVLFDRKLRTAVLAIKQALSAGGKLSPQQQAAASYLNNTNRETFGEALSDVAYDLAYYELDPKNNGAGSTFAGEGGRYALAFQQWVKENLDKSTSQVLDEMIAEHKRNAKENERFAAAVTKYHEQLDSYAETQRKAAEKRTKQTINRAPRKKKIVRIGDIEEVEPEKVVSDKNMPSVQMLTEIHPMLRRMLEQGKTQEVLQILADAKGNPYYAALAQRLLDTNMTAKTRLVDADTMESLSDDPNVKQSLDDSLKTLSQIVMDLYPADQQATIIAGLRSTNLREVVSAIGRMQSTIRQQDALPGNIETLANTVDLFNRQYAWNGKYDPNTDEIVLRSGAGKLTNHLFLHEALHAAASHLLDNPERLTGIQRQGYDRLVELYTHAKQVLSPNEFADEKIYGLQDIHEFVSEALTNPVFQAQLRALRYKAAPFSLWNTFTQAIAKLFNVKKGYESNVMVEAMLATDAMIAGPMSLEGLTATTGPKALRTKPPRIKAMRPGMPNQPSAIKRLMTSRSWGRAAIREYHSMSAEVRPTALGLLTLRQLDDLIAGRLPQISNFIRVTEDFLSRKNSILRESGEISQKWEALQSADPDMSRQVGVVMHMATMKELDPDKATTNQRNANQDLMIEWNKLDPRAKGIYREVRDFYERRYSNYKRLMNRRIIQMRQLGVSETTITEIRNEFEKGALKGPYFPLMRFGRFWYQIGKGASREYYMFESEAARDRHIEERLERDPHLADTIGSNIGNDFTKQMDYHARESKFLKETFAAIDKLKTGNKQELKDSIYQTYLSNQPDRSMRNQFIHRNNVAGYSEDALRSFATSSFNMAYQLARFQYSPEMFSQLEAARMQLKDRFDPNVGYDPSVVKESDELRDYVNEVDRRLNLMLNPTDIGTIPSMLSNVGFIYYLTSVASAVTNILGGVIIGFPTLVGQQVKANPKMGYTAATGKVLYETSKAAAQIMMTGFNVQVGERVRDSSLLSPSFDRSSALTSTERAAYNRFVADGLIDITSTYDQSGLASTPTENYSGLRNKSMQVLTYAFHHAERFNREVMAMSAFRAAMEKRQGMANRQQAFAESIAEAKAITQRAMFDYSSTNKPRYFQHPVARIVLQFKQFPQQMTFFLAHNLLNSIKDLPIEQKREARARFVGTMGMSAIFSGVTGLWGFSTVASIVNAVFNIAGGGDDDEEPFDFELSFVNWANETFGAGMGTAITRGSLNAITGLDIGGRVKLDEMWFRDGRKNQDEAEALQTFLVDLLGPTIGIGVNAARAVDLWNQGHGDRAIEAVSPAFIKNALIAQRMAREGGATTLRGDMLTEDPSAFILMMQGLGLRSQELAERQYYNITVKGHEQAILKERQNLLNYYGLTFMANDVENNSEAFDKIMEFNDKHPSVRIPADSITGSIIERMKKSSQTENGLYIDKRLRESLTRQNYMAGQ